MSRGRRALFSAQLSIIEDVSTSMVIAADPRRFALRVEGGGEIIVD